MKREYKKKPLLIGADLQRLAAQEQLKILSEKILDLNLRDLTVSSLKDELSGIFRKEKNKINETK